MVGFAAAVIAAVLLLFAALVVGPLANAWHPVVTVDGQTFNRTDLRARMAIDASVIAGRRAALRTLQAAAEVTPDDAQRISSAIDADAADPLRAAIDGLVADALILRDAPPPAAPADPITELRSAMAADVAVRIEAVTADEPFTEPATTGNAASTPPTPPRRTDPTGAVGAIRTALASWLDKRATTPSDAVAELSAAGWRAATQDRWIPAAGPVDGLPDTLVAAARETAADGVLPAVIDPVTGTIAAGRVRSDRPPTIAPPDASGLDQGALARWAEARARERAQAASLDQRLGSPIAQTRVRELVVGDQPTEGVTGKWASFAHLVALSLSDDARSGAEPQAAAEALAAELRAMSITDRAARFAELVAQANATAGSDPLRQSGETPYFTREQLLPEIATGAFADGVHPGDVIGPVVTSAGPELFLVRAFFDGTLDERANAALVEARSTDDLVALARRISPAGQWTRAAGELWRGDAEWATGTATADAYTKTPVGGRSGPVLVDNQIVVVEPLERATAVPAAEIQGRLRTSGLAAWLAGRIEAATIVRDPEPLPGIAVEPDATPSPSLDAPAIPTPFDPLPSTP